MIKSTAILFIFCSFSLIMGAKANVALKNLSAEGVDSLTAELISDRVRLELFRSEYYNVMERHEMKAVLTEQKMNLSGLCDEARCDVELGRILSVDNIITGSIGQVDSLFLLSLRVIDVETAKIVQVADVDVQGGLQELFAVGIPALVNELIGIGTVSMIASDTVSVDPLEKNKEEKSRYKISYRQRLKEENRKRQGIHIDTVVVVNEQKREKKVKVKGPNIVAGLASVGAFITAISLAESEEEYEKRSENAYEQGQLASYLLYKNDARKRRVAKGVLFGVSGVSLVTFIVSF